MPADELPRSELEPLKEPVSGAVFFGRALERRIEAKERDHAQGSVDGPLLTFLIRSPSTDLIPTVHDRICLVPTNKEAPFGNVASVKIYIPIDNETGIEIAKPGVLYVSVRNTDGETTRYRIDEGEGVTEYLRYDESHNVIDPDGHPIDEQTILENLIIVAHYYALETQQKKADALPNS